jgi:hypothetical protein
VIDIATVPRDRDVLLRETTPTRFVAFKTLHPHATDSEDRAFMAMPDVQQVEELLTLLHARDNGTPIHSQQATQIMTQQNFPPNMPQMPAFNQAPQFNQMGGQPQMPGYPPQAPQMQPQHFAAGQQQAQPGYPPQMQQLPPQPPQQAQQQGFPPQMPQQQMPPQMPQQFPPQPQGYPLQAQGQQFQQQFPPQMPPQQVQQFNPPAPTMQQLQQQAPPAATQAPPEATPPKRGRKAAAAAPPAAPTQAATPSIGDNGLSAILDSTRDLLGRLVAQEEASSRTMSAIATVVRLNTKLIIALHKATGGNSTDFQAYIESTTDEEVNAVLGAGKG